MIPYKPAPVRIHSPHHAECLRCSDWLFILIYSADYVLTLGTQTVYRWLNLFLSLADLVFYKMHVKHFKKGSETQIQRISFMSFYNVP